MQFNHPETFQLPIFFAGYLASCFRTYAESRQVVDSSCSAGKYCLSEVTFVGKASLGRYAPYIYRMVGIWEGPIWEVLGVMNYLGRLDE